MKRMVFCLILIFLLASMPPLLGVAEGEPENFPEFLDLKENNDIETVLAQTEMIKQSGVLGNPVNLSHIVSSYKVFHYCMGRLDSERFFKRFAFLVCADIPAGQYHGWDFWNWSETDGICVIPNCADYESARRYLEEMGIIQPD